MIIEHISDGVKTKYQLGKKAKSPVQTRKEEKKSIKESKVFKSETKTRVKKSK